MENKTSKHWNTFVNILNELYPKGDKARGKALVFLAYMEMAVRGQKFDEGGKPITFAVNKTRPETK